MNQDLFVEKKKFISASRASQETGYAQDYIGQLCRGKRIPARRIGKSWYVDRAALLEHKKKHPRKNRKEEVVREKVFTPQFAPQTVIPSGTSQDEQIEPRPYLQYEIRYEDDDRPIIPVLTRELIKPIEVKEIKEVPVVKKEISWHEPAHKKPVKAAVLSRKSTYRFPAATFAVSLVILISLGFTWSNLNLSRVAESNLNKTNQISSVFAYVQSLYNSLFSKESKLATIPAEQVGRGMVVVPDSSAHDAQVAQIKSSFSDQTNISFDEEGDSGVITPVFTQTGDAEHYAFVLVPIKSENKQQ